MPEPETQVRDVEAKRIVVKLGTNTLCDPDGRPDTDLLDALAAEMHALASQGKQFIVVSSGSIGCGRHVMGMRELPQDVTQRQALAALGQHRLMGAWDAALRKHKSHAAQLLLTHHTFDRRRSYNHLRQCIEELLSMQAVPILNENDSVSVREIDATFGDNDRLGALVAAKMDADLYIILSDVTGLFDKPPHADGAQVVHTVDAVTDEILDMAGKGRTHGRGGMRSKLESAKQLTEAGVPVCIAYGRAPGVISSILAGEETGTWFHPVGHQDGKKRFLVAAHSAGQITIDEGALKALQAGNHLLPAGVRGVEGEFPVESVVELVLDSHVVGKAVSQFSSKDLRACMGCQSDEVKALLELEGSVNVTRKGRLALL